MALDRWSSFDLAPIPFIVQRSGLRKNHQTGMTPSAPTGFSMCLEFWTPMISLDLPIMGCR